MGSLPEKSSEPLDLRIKEEVRLERYTRQSVTYVSEKGDRVPAFLLAPESADSDTALARGERSDSGTHAACSRPPMHGSVQ